MRSEGSCVSRSLSSSSSESTSAFCAQPRAETIRRLSAQSPVSQADTQRLSRDCRYVPALSSKPLPSAFGLLSREKRLQDLVPDLLDLLRSFRDGVPVLK